MRMAARLEKMGVAHYQGLTMPAKGGPVWTNKVREAPDHIWSQPFKWKRGRKIFVNSMSDLFHKFVARGVIDRVFATMAMTPRHTYQVLTKRSDIMRQYLTHPDVTIRISEKIDIISGCAMRWKRQWPLPNVWIGVSVEDQVRADQRVPDLQASPAALRFLSVEPMLGSVRPNLSGIGLVIVGGESGSGARGWVHDWPRALRDQCKLEGVPFFFKQGARGEVPPADLVIQEWPALKRSA